MEGGWRNEDGGMKKERGWRGSKGYGSEGGVGWVVFLKAFSCRRVPGLGRSR